MKTSLYLLLTPVVLFADIFPFQTIEKANQAYKQGEFHKSARLFQSLKKDEPTVAYNLANALYKAGMYDEALKNYAKAKGVDDATREHNIGNTYFKKNELYRAIEHYENALKIREDVETRYNLELAKKQQDEQNKQDKNREKKHDKEEKKQQQSKDQEDKPTQEKKEKVEQIMSQEEKLRKKELTHLMKQLSQKKMPTMIYQATQEKEEDDKNPW